MKQLRALWLLARTIKLRNPNGFSTAGKFVVVLSTDEHELKSTRSIDIPIAPTSYIPPREQAIFPCYLVGHVTQGVTTESSLGALTRHDFCACAYDKQDVRWVCASDEGTH